MQYTFWDEGPLPIDQPSIIAHGFYGCWEVQWNSSRPKWRNECSASSVCHEFWRSCSCLEQLMGRVPVPERSPKCSQCTGNCSDPVFCFSCHSNCNRCTGNCLKMNCRDLGGLSGYGSNQSRSRAICRTLRRSTAHSTILASAGLWHGEPSLGLICIPLWVV